MNSPVQLSEPAANFRALLVKCKSDDGATVTQLVENPEENTAFSITMTMFANNAMFVKSKTYVTNGSTINTWNKNGGYNTGQWSSTGQVEFVDKIGIIKVIGIR